MESPELKEAIDALRAQQLCSDMQRSLTLPKPDDYRYTEFIGEWDGYQAPEIRLEKLHRIRKEMREKVLAKYLQ